MSNQPKSSSSKQAVLRALYRKQATVVVEKLATAKTSEEKAAARKALNDYLLS